MEIQEKPSQSVNDQCSLESPERPSNIVDELGSETSCKTIMPEVDVHLKPYEGMTFKSLEEAREFYEVYGKTGGFDIRSSSTKYSKREDVERVLIDKMYVCSKEGETNRISKDIKKTGTGRTNCKALIRFKLDTEQGLWVVKKFVEEHNHDVATPRRRHLLRANRTVSNVRKKLIRQFKESNIPTNKVIAFLEHGSGGFDKLGCTERDIRNYKRDVRETLKGHDAQMLIDYFKFAKEKNPSFYYAYKVDEDNKLSHCFWVDAIARLNFEYFGDIVTFDTTHNTNQFGLIWAPFVGINHHRQSIFLGCGFLPNESADSFSWIFEKFIEAMGRAPNAVVTDQDLGINAALSRIFPNSRHRLCIWHILDKVKDKLGVWASNERFMSSFRDCIWNSENPDDFEAKWSKIMAEDGPCSNEWLASLFDMRQRWIPAYHKHDFWAGITSTQRSEGMNSLLKMNTSCHNTLHDFAMIFERTLSRQREQELIKDHNSLEKKPKLKTKLEMEKQMSVVYTRTNFYIFQVELEKSLYDNVNQFIEDDAEIKYAVASCGDRKNCKVLTYSKSTEIVKCSCLMFDFNGIPCEHILAYLKNKYVNELPHEYIMKRWTRDIKRGIVIDKDGNIIRNNNQNVYSSRFSELTYMANKLVEGGLSSDVNYHIALKFMQDALNSMRIGMNKDVENEEEDEFERIKEMGSSQLEVHEPDQAKTKGRKRGKRMKPGRENPAKRSRKCNYCGKRGQNHDSRNCPLRKTSVSEVRDSSNMLEDAGEEESSNSESTPSSNY